MWTQTLPDAPGWYWMKLSQSDDPKIILVEVSAPPGVVAFSTALVCRSMIQLTGSEFYDGPLQAPN